MKRLLIPPIQLFAAANSSSSTSTALMSSGNSWRAGRGRRGYSGNSDGTGDGPITGDSHFRQVQRANTGLRPSSPSYNNSPPPVYYSPRPHQTPHRQSFGQGQHSPRYGSSQQFRPQHYGSNQQFGPQRQQQQHPQQFKPSPPKDYSYRNWEYANPQPPLQCERFTVLSYNILADYLAMNHRQKLYYHIPPYIMDWERRKRSIVFEIGLWSADILCLQEVDKFEELKEELGLRGYTGIWKMRTGDPVDGCAIFWRNSRFKLLHDESIEFNKLGLRDNVAQICVFESLYDCNDSESAATVQSLRKPNKVVVCNIHVLFNPKRGEIKLGQVRVLLSQAYAVSKRWDDAPVIVCGDFNSTPKSPLYNFIAEKKLDLSELPRNEVSGQASAMLSPKFKFGARFADKSSQGLPTQVHVGTENCDSQGLPTQVHVVTENCDSQGLPTQVHVGSENYDSPVHKQNCPDESFKKETFVDTSLSFSPVVEEGVNKEVDKQLRGGKCESESSLIGSQSIDLGDTSGNLHNETKCLGIPVKDASHDSSLLDMKLESLSLDETGRKEEHANSDREGLYPLNNTVGIDVNNTYKYLSKYDPSAWTPGEIEAATGSSCCIVMEHPLKLHSVYGEVEDSYGTRDQFGEPSVTSYHRDFFGTVDYIWRTKGLQTSRVLATIPKQSLQWTQGFPTKKWGSDHIALVTELAFSNTSSSSPSCEVKLQD